MRYLFLVIISHFSLSLTSQNFIEDFESGLESWKEIVGITTLVSDPTVEGSNALRLWNFRTRDNPEAMLLHKTFDDDYGIYSFYARGDDEVSELNFFFQYQNADNYYQITHKPEGTSDPEFIVAKVIDGVYTELYKQEAVEKQGKWVYISVDRTCDGRMYVSYNNNNVLDINETDILDTGTVGLRAVSELNYFDRIEFEKHPSQVYDIEATICTGQEYTVGNKRYSTTGSYRDTIPGNIGCDSIIELALRIVDTIRVELDTVLCPESFIMFDNEIIDIPGTYTFDFVTPTGCDSIVNYRVTASPDFSLGQDRAICGNEQITLSIESQNSYSWNTGETSATLSVNQAGTYSVEVVDYNNCVQRDTINVRIQCELKMFSPNIFTPNNDNVHDIWKPEFDILPLTYSLSIYDRWGNLQFQSTDPNQPWDGKQQNTDVSAGLYIWHVSADSQVFTGNVTVIR